MSNTPYPVKQEMAEPNKVMREQLYSASANEIDEKKPELKRVGGEDGGGEEKRVGGWCRGGCGGSERGSAGKLVGGEGGGEEVRVGEAGERRLVERGERGWGKRRGEGRVEGSGMGGGVRGVGCRKSYEGEMRGVKSGKGGLCEVGWGEGAKGGGGRRGEGEGLGEEKGVKVGGGGGGGGLWLCDKQRRWGRRAYEGGRVRGGKLGRVDKVGCVGGGLSGWDVKGLSGGGGRGGGGRVGL
ncbi:hypothetical protein Tco_0183675 [Tanacetum coccineum]